MAKGGPHKSQLGLGTQLHLPIAVQLENCNRCSRNHNEIFRDQPELADREKPLTQVLGHPPSALMIAFSFARAW
jgi:hypothetical protein